MLSNTTIEELCRKLRPLLGAQVDKLYMKYSLATDQSERLEIEKLVHALYHKHLGKSLLNDEIMLEPPQKDVIDADYSLGTIIYSDKELYTFGLREKDWIRHMCVSGMSGSGKTTFAYTILGCMILKEKPFLVFDWKRSFRPVLKVRDDTMVFSIGNESIKNFFRTNINIPPPGIGPKQWITIIADLLSEAYQTSFGVHKVITETLHQAFTDFKVYEGSQNYPNWYQIRDRLEMKENNMAEKRSSNRESEWITSALRIAHELTFGSFGEVINYKGHDMIDIAELMKHKIVFELDSLSSAEKRFFTNYILTYIFKLKKSDPNNLCSEFRNLILVDEAHNIFLKNKSSFVEESITEVIFREIREFGVGLVCLDQHVSKLSDVVSGNSACNIAFQQQLPEDIRAISALMQLNSRREDKSKYFSMLPVGSAIVKLAERYHNPFLIKVPFIDVKNIRVNDESLQETMAKRVSKIHVKYTDAIRKTFKEFVVSENEEIHPMDYAKAKKEYESKRVSITNHLQKDILLIVIELIKKGFDIKRVRSSLIKKGYRRSDITPAISNLPYERFVEAKQNELKNKSNSQIIKELKKEQVAALELIAQHSYAVTEFYRSLNISVRKGNSLKNSLQELGLIEVVEDKTSAGMKKIICLSPKGRELLEKAGIPII